MGGLSWGDESMTQSNYPKLTSDVSEREARVLDFWSEAGIFEKSLERTQERPRYVFFEGPPTANGTPHFGHMMARVYKDLFPRYKTMRGYHVVRKGGWDTHGLPVELEVEKLLGLNSKQEIEAYGVEPFVEACKENVWKYVHAWEEMIRRMGFWIDLDDPYITYTDDYIESGWWALKTIWDQGLLYRGHKVLPYCPRCGTPLSSHEVAQGYERTTDPAVYVKFALRDRPNEYVLAWTTTPWTLPGNVALAVGPGIDYAKVQQGEEIYYLANELVDDVIDGDYEVRETIKGREMDGWAYEPPFSHLKDALDADGESPEAWYVIAETGEMVSTEEGTGVVHTAVMYGEADYELGETFGLPKRHTVDPNGRFTEDVAPYAGWFVKEADKQITKDLDADGKLYKQATYEHNYPFCWRCDTPLLYYALDSWFIRTTARQAEIIANNQQVHWHPEHMRDGRFGNFLESMKDWALSRDRYWGTPLPVWVCTDCGQDRCVGSRQELVENAQDPQLARDVEPHRPYIDEVTLACPECGGTMERVPYVIDCWFDSGMMHTAQWHAPFENADTFEEQFPADFICEGLDQTRGWFYSLLVTSTLLYPDREPPHPYRHVMVTGMGLDAEGKKMSKSRGNVLDPMDFASEFGADALRWYLYSASAPWRDVPLSKEETSKVLYGFLNRVANVYNFFALYAAIDGFVPDEHQVELAARPPLDRWLTSRLSRTAERVASSLDAYDVVTATQAIDAFVDDLSNWYVRVSRPRFWGEGLTDDKRSAYATLYEALLGLSKLMAPFTPFLTEDIYRGLGEPEGESVHLARYPEPDPDAMDDALERDMALAREVVSLGRAARQNCGIKVRQPLRTMRVQHRHARELSPELAELVKRELNLKDWQFTDDDLRRQHVRTRLEPNMAAIGPDFGPKAPAIQTALLEQVDPGEVERSLQRDGRYTLSLGEEAVDLTGDHLEIHHEADAEAPVAFDDDCVVALDAELTPELQAEGHVRELVHHVQQLRKAAGFEVSDRIELYVAADRELSHALQQHQTHVQDETLAVSLRTDLPEGDSLEYVDDVNVNGLTAKVGLARVEPS